MNSIRIKNVRSLKDTKKINLKKINVLVGKNSSGKSTFLRVFPLLKQSFYKRINGPIFWSGDYDDYVDFGSFDETITKAEKDKKIEFEFEIPYNSADILSQLEMYRIFRCKSKKYNKSKRSLITISIMNKNGVDVIDSLKVKSDKYTLELSDESISFNNEKIEYSAKEKYIDNENVRNIYRNAMIDFVDRNLNIDIIYRNIYKEIFKEYEEIGDNKYIFTMVMSNILAEMAVKVFLNKGIKNDILFSEILLDREKNDKDMTSYEKKTILSEIKIENFKNKINTARMTNDLLVIYLGGVMEYGIRYLRKYFMNVNYIKPVRAHAERYYRLRNLSVEQVDADGKNLPIFINSLTKTELDKYNKWIYGNFAFKVRRQTRFGHVSINIEKDGNEFNISDTGYGYSQILPIITQIWAILNKKEIADIPIVFAIEQPELHLHPELQAKLVDVIVKVAEKENIQFILETHSDVMIERIGNLIYKKYLNEKDVNVILFEKEAKEINTKVSISKYDEKGYLEKWPIGFFSVNDIE